jgi:hypothetical protein
MSKSKQNKTIEVPTRSERGTVSLEQQIAARAYALYLARGAEDGHDLDDWLQAEQQLLGEISPQTES